MLPTAPAGAAVAVAGLFLAEVGRVEHHQPCEFAARGGGDDLALEAAAREQGNAPAVVEVGMGQQQVVDGGRVEAEGIGVFLVQFASALVESAVDEDALAGAFDEMAGTR